MTPETGETAPASAFSSDVFPDPLGPTIPRKSPFEISKVASLTTGSPSYAMEILSVLIKLSVITGIAFTEVCHIQGFQSSRVSTQGFDDGDVVEAHERQVAVFGISWFAGEIIVPQVVDV